MTVTTTAPTSASPGRTGQGEPVRFVARHIIDQEPNGDPIVGQILWEKHGDAEAVPLTARRDVTAEEWATLTDGLPGSTPALA